MTTSWIAKQDLQRCCLLGSFHRKSFLLCHGYMGAFGSTSSCTDLTMKPRQSGLPPPNSFPPQQNLQLVSTARTSNFVFKNTFTSRRTIISFVYAHRYIRHEIPCLAWSLTWGRVILCEWNLEMHFYFDLISIYRVRNVSLFTVGYMHTHEDDQQWLNVCTQGKKKKVRTAQIFLFRTDRLLAGIPRVAVMQQNTFKHTNSPCCIRDSEFEIGVTSERETWQTNTASRNGTRIIVACCLHQLSNMMLYWRRRGEDENFCGRELVE